MHYDKRMHCIRTITPWSAQGNADTIKQLAQQQPTKCIHNVLLHTNQADTRSLSCHLADIAQTLKQ